MATLKRLTLGLAIVPLAISIAFAAAINDPIGGIDIIIKKPIERQATVKLPAATKERRVIKQKSVKPTSTEAPTDEKYLEHDPRVSACWRRIIDARASGNTKYMEACEIKYAKVNSEVLHLNPMSDPVISGSDDLPEALSERE